MVRASCRLRQRVASRRFFAFGLFALEVGPRGWMYAALRDRDAVEGAVQLAVAAAVESVSLVFAGAGVEWCDASVAGELGVRAEAVDRPDLGEQLGGADGAAAGQLQQPWRECLRALF